MHLGDNPAKDNLRLICSPHSVSKLLVIPSVDLAVTFNQWCGRVHVKNFLRKRPVGACLGAGGEDRGEVKNISESSVCEDVVFELVGGEVADELEETELVVDDQEHGLVLVDAGEGLVDCGRGRGDVSISR